MIERLRAARPDLALSSDFIVGFPGESEEDFQASLDLIDAVGFAQAYSFKYSPRPGTPAALLGVQVPEAEKEARLARLQQRVGVHQTAFNAAQIGKTVPVLFDRVGRKAGQMIGRSPYLQSVHAEIGADAMGRILEVEVIAAGPNSLSARAAPRSAAA